jgi:hypothetical protein
MDAGSAVVPSRMKPGTATLRSSPSQVAEPASEVCCSAEVCATDEDCVVLAGCCSERSGGCPDFSAVVNRAHVEAYAAAHQCPPLQPVCGQGGGVLTLRPRCGEGEICEFAQPGWAPAQRSLSDAVYFCGFARGP